MKNGIKATALVVALTMASTGANAAELVTNGGFEKHSFDGWTQSGNTVSVYVAEQLGTQAPHSGRYQAALGPRDTGGSLAQMLSTVVNQTYAVSFSLANLGNPPTNSFVASFGGVPIFVLIDAPAFSYQTFSFTGLATNARTTLTFDFRNDPSFFLLDDVSVQGMTGAVPEPASWAMMMLGFAALAAALRWRSARVSSWHGNAASGRLSKP